MDNATRRAATEWAVLRALSPSLGDTPLTPYILALVSEDMARQEQPVLSDGLTVRIDPAAFYRTEPESAVVAAYRKPEEPTYNRFLVVPAEEESADDNLPIEVVGGVDTDSAFAQLAEIEAEAEALLDSMQKRELALNGHKAPAQPLVEPTPELPLPPLLDCPLPTDEGLTRIAELEPCAVDPSGEEQARRYVLRQIKDKQGIDPEFIRDLTGWKSPGVTLQFINSIKEQNDRAINVLPRVREIVMKELHRARTCGITMIMAGEIINRFGVTREELAPLVAECEEEAGISKSWRLAFREATSERMKSMRARQKAEAAA